MKLMKINELSEVIGLSESTIYKYTCEKRIPYIKINNSVRFSVDDIEEWIKEKRVAVIK